VAIGRLVTHSGQFSMAADEDVSGHGLNWTLFGYGICADRLTGWLAATGRQQGGAALRPCE
jgi:hypothetical protein